MYSRAKSAGLSRSHSRSMQPCSPLTFSRKDLILDGQRGRGSDLQSFEQDDWYSDHC